MSPNGREMSDAEFTKSTSILNERLPKTRVIAQALLLDEQGRPLVCELAYKKFWDLPGGVVDPHESPAHALTREIHEELGVDAQVKALRVISWLPPWRGWDDAVLFVFEVVVDRAASDFQLQRSEIAGIHALDESNFDARLAPYTVRILRRAIQASAAGEVGVYLENGEAPAWG